jgi:hypothetical protein
LNLDEVEEGANYKFISMPLYVKGAGETPVRVMAIQGSLAASLATGLTVATMAVLF